MIAAIRDWFLQLWFAHHNARVLLDMEWRMSCLLDHATGGQLSKPYYDFETMQSAVNDYINDLTWEAFNEGVASVERSAGEI